VFIFEGVKSWEIKLDKNLAILTIGRRIIQMEGIREKGLTEF
jgi:hypothetical protein